MEASRRSSERLSIDYDGSSSEDRCWKHEVNAIGDTDQNAVYGPPYVASPPRNNGDGTGGQAPNAGGNGTGGRPSVNSPNPSPTNVRDQARLTRRSGDSSHQTPSSGRNPSRLSVTIQNLQRVRDMLNTSDPALAETPSFVQLVGQVSKIIQQTMQCIETYRE